MATELDVLARLRAALPAIAARAAALDEAAAFPAEDVALLATIGLPAIPLPRREGGLGAGSEPEGTETLFDVLRLLGSANLSLGRLFEAHVNAVHLAFRYAAPAQQEVLARHARAGELYGLWVTDPPGRPPLSRAASRLVGGKGPASGAGHLRHALVTVTQAGTVRMALLDLGGQEPVDPLGPRLHGMRAAANGTITLDGAVLPDTALFGADGDYLREPSLSAGAWRTMAVTLGGVDALLAATRAHLERNGQCAAPLQQARFGRMLIARQTAALWTRHAAETAEYATAPIPDQVATVNLARIAVETACLDAMRHAQRALGLASMVRPHPVERLLRDLATYLRQPAPDAVLTEAAAHHLAP